MSECEEEVESIYEEPEETDQETGAERILCLSLSAVPVSDFLTVHEVHPRQSGVLFHHQGDYPRYPAESGCK